MNRNPTEHIGLFHVIWMEESRRLPRRNGRYLRPPTKWEKPSYKNPLNNWDNGTQWTGGLANAEDATGATVQNISYPAVRIADVNLTKFQRAKVDRVAKKAPKQRRGRWDGAPWWMARWNRALVLYLRFPDRDRVHVRVAVRWRRRRAPRQTWLVLNG